MHFKKVIVVFKTNPDSPSMSKKGQRSLMKVISLSQNHHNYNDRPMSSSGQKEADDDDTNQFKSIGSASFIEVIH